MVPQEFWDHLLACEGRRFGVGPIFTGHLLCVKYLADITRCPCIHLGPTQLPGACAKACAGGENLTMPALLGYSLFSQQTCVTAALISANRRYLIQAHDPVRQGLLLTPIIGWETKVQRITATCLHKGTSVKGARLSWEPKPASYTSLDMSLPHWSLDGLHSGYADAQKKAEEWPSWCFPGVHARAVRACGAIGRSG